MTGDIEKAAWMLAIAVWLHGCMTGSDYFATKTIERGMDGIAAAIREGE